MPCPEYRANPAVDRAAPAGMATPLDAFFLNALDMLKEQIRRAARPSESREALAHALIAFPLIDSACAASARADASYAYVSMYENFRLRGGAFSAHSMLHGVPRAINLYVGAAPQAAAAVATAGVDNALVSELRRDFATTVETVEGKSDEQLALYRERWFPPDLAGDIPARVGILAGRMRAVTQRVHQARPTASHPACANRACNRQYYAGFDLGTGTPGDARDVDRHADDDADDADDAGHEVPNYWTECGGSTFTSFDPRRFCCRHCQAHWTAAARAAVLADEIELDADAAVERTGYSRIGEAFRAALKRNEAFARKLRTVTKSLPALAPLSSRDVVELRRRLARMLNVDLALLYAASTLAEDAQLAARSTLPGTTSGWRATPYFWRRSLAATAALYSRHARADEQICTTMLTVPKYARRARDGCLELFGVR